MSKNGHTGVSVRASTSYNVPQQLWSQLEQTDGHTARQKEGQMYLAETGK